MLKTEYKALGFEEDDVLPQDQINPEIELSELYASNIGQLEPVLAYICLSIAPFDF